MGNCLRSPPSIITDDLSYPSEVNINLQSPKRRVKCHLNPPHALSALTLKVGSLTLTASACLLSGMDAMAGIDRGTQEAVFHLAVEDAALVGVFDGHGKDGKKVVEFCSEWFQSYFKQHKEEFRAEARVALVQAFERCDAAVKLEIECMLSGRYRPHSSALLIYFTEFTITTACVGEVRAVMGTVPTPGAAPSPQREMNHAPDQFRRALEPARALDAYQVTGESRPEHQAELDRILLAGGRVARLSSIENSKVGPYRVWKKDMNLPGLAASRSLCDKMASAIGVVPTPIIRQYSVNPQQDLFLIVATDGLW